MFLYIVGTLNPTSAFMSGKLKMEGNLGKAMALEKVMKKMNTRSYHTTGANFIPRGFHSPTTSNRNYSNFGKKNNAFLQKIYTPFLLGDIDLYNFFLFTAYHNVAFSRKYGDAPPATYTSIPQVNL